MPGRRGVGRGVGGGDLRICSLIFQDVIVFTSHAGLRSPAGVSEYEMRSTQLDAELLLFYSPSTAPLQTPSSPSLPDASLGTLSVSGSAAAAVAVTVKAAV